jgi:hypothetical protein
VLAALEALVLVEDKQVKLHVISRVDFSIQEQHAEHVTLVFIAQEQLVWNLVSVVNL